MFIHRLKNWWRNRRCYVIADPTDSGITLSHALFRHMRGSVLSGEPAKVFVFFMPSENRYGFMINPRIDSPTQLCDIQFNSKYRCIGFESLCPTVSRIFYDYGIKNISPCKLSVSICRDALGRIYYQIERPYAKFAT